MFDEEKGDCESEQHLEATRARKASQARSRRNRESGREFEEEMFRRRSRYLVLFLTLNYKPEYRDEITLPTIQGHRDRFIRNMESAPLLQNIEGYLWKLEEGERSGGLHLHFLIFYSAKHRSDVYIARLIGEYWVNVVTRGWGNYWNSNAGKEKFLNYGFGIGIGQVNRTEDDKREALRHLIDYMSKKEQYPTMCGNRPNRFFGTGIP